MQKKIQLKFYIDDQSREVRIEDEIKKAKR